MALTPRRLVEAPQPRGSRYGLLTAAVGPLDLDDHSSGSGIVYDPATCGRVRNYEIDCPEDGEPGTKVFDPNDLPVEGEPFALYATLRCGAAGYPISDLTAKVRRRFMNGEPHGVESALAAMLAGDASMVAQIAPDSSSIAAVIGELEQWLYGDQRYGNVGYLHMPVRASAYAAEAYQLVKDGPLWKTPMGTIVVFGGGYTDGLAYITGQTTVWRTGIDVAPPEQTFDRTTNQHNLLAEAAYVITYDCAAAVSTFDPPGNGS